MELFAPNTPLDSQKESTKVLNESALSNEPAQSGSSDAEVLSLLYRGFRSRFVWKNGVVGSQAVCTAAHEESISWINFFLDLLYVAVISNVSIILTSCELNARTIAVVFAVTTALYKFRLMIDEYSIRFYQDDLFHRTLFFIYIMGIYFMGANISNLYNSGTIVSAHRLLAGDAGDRAHCYIDHHYYNPFAIGFVMCNVSILIIYCVAFFHDASGKVTEQYFYRAMLLFTSMVIMAVSMHGFGEETQIALLVAAPEIELAVPILVVFCRKYLHYTGTIGINNYPVNYLISQERLGIYILLFLGEGVILSMEQALDHSDYNYIYSIASMLLIFLLGVQYFDRVQRKEGEVHACRRHLFWGLVFLQVGHRFLAFALLFVTTGISDHSSSGGLILSVGCGFSTLIMVLMRMLHKGIEHKFSSSKRMIYMLVELVVCAAHFLVILADGHHVSHGDRIVMHACITLFYVIFDTFGAVHTVLFYNKAHQGPRVQLHLAHSLSRSIDKPPQEVESDQSEAQEVGRITLD
jgi:hypothetical protein